MGRNIRDLLHKELQQQGSQSAHQLSTNLNVSRQYVHRILHEMVASGDAIKQGTPPKVVYSLSEPTAMSGEVNKQARSSMKKQKPVVIWLTGLSGSGKSTVAQALEKRLFATGKHSYVLDEQMLNQDLTSSPKDQSEAVRRLGEVARLMTEAGLIVIVASVSAFTSDRNKVRTQHDEGEFIEAYLDCPLAVCKQRDPSGLYEKAAQQRIVGTPGVDVPYEAPHNPEITIATNALSIQESSNQIYDYLVDRAFI